MDTDTKLLAGVPKRNPKWVAEVFQPLHSDAWITEHVDAKVPRFDRALDFRDNRFDGTHEWNYRERDKALARLPELGQSIIVGAHASKFEFDVVIKKSPARPIGKQHLGVDAVAVQRLEAFRRLIDFSRNFLPALRIIAALGHRRRAIADVTALNFAIHDPTFHRMIEFFIAHFDHMRNSVAPLRLGHPAGVCVPAKL